MLVFCCAWTLLRLYIAVFVVDCASSSTCLKSRFFQTIPQSNTLLRLLSSTFAAFTAGNIKYAMLTFYCVCVLSHLYYFVFVLYCAFIHLQLHSLFCSKTDRMRVYHKSYVSVRIPLFVAFHLSNLLRLYSATVYFYKCVRLFFFCCVQNILLVSRTRHTFAPSCETPCCPSQCPSGTRVIPEKRRADHVPAALQAAPHPAFR